MLQLMLIIAFGSIVLHDQATHPHAVQWLPVWLSITVPAGACLFITAVLMYAGHVAGRLLDRAGSYRALTTFDSMVVLGRWSMVAIHLFSVFFLDYTASVRAVTGGFPLLAELLSMLPVLGVIIAGWWATYPIDRRLREASLVGALDRGLPIHAPLTRSGFVLMQVRHQLSLVLIPIITLSAVHRLAPWLLAQLWPASSQNAQLAEMVLLGVQLCTLAALLTLMPLAVRWIWLTTPLRAGPVADDLMALCATARVRVRRILVWRTQGTMINGAVIGFFSFARNILLTDALLEMLPAQQVRAVLAHELGHIRRHHIFWLGLTCLTTMTLLSAATSLLLGNSPEASLLDFGSAGLALALTGVVFGYISRRFEWQADAYAVQLLTQAQSPESPVVTEDAVAAMVGALDSVSRLNHLPLDRFSFRHGTIQRRIENLLDIRGCPISKVPIDRTVWRLKIVSAVLSVLAAGLLGRDVFVILTHPADQQQATAITLPLCSPSATP